MANTARLLIAAAAGLVLGRFTSVVFSLLVVAVALLVALVLRVIAQEREQTTSSMARVALAVGVGALAGRLIAWFGIIGGAVALVILVVVFVVAGGELI